MTVQRLARTLGNASTTAIRRHLVKLEARGPWLDAEGASTLIDRRFLL